MQVSPFTEVTDRDELERIVRAEGTAELVTVDPDGLPQATLLPILWEGDRVLAHAAKTNPQFPVGLTDVPALAVVTGPQHYVSPTWYPSKAKRGLAVPTWNYVSVHLRGTLSTHADPARLMDLVSRLSDRHEDERARPWSTADAPQRYLDGLLLGIVGIELTVTEVVGKAKLSQNRTLADHLGVIDGLRAEDSARAAAVADAMEALDRS